MERRGRRSPGYGAFRTDAQPGKRMSSAAMGAGRAKRARSVRVPEIGMIFQSLIAALNKKEY